MKSIVPIFLALELCACASVPPAPPKPTAFFLISDCSGPAFAIAVDEHGHTAVMGGDAPPPKPEDQALIAAAANAQGIHRVRIRVGDCQDD